MPVELSRPQQISSRTANARRHLELRLKSAIRKKLSSDLTHVAMSTSHNRFVVHATSTSLAVRKGVVMFDELSREGREYVLYPAIGVREV